MVLSARSNHPGGVQIGLVDGSVRFASNTIALTVWQNLGIPDDRNPIANY
jgi:prepilin-type processing-associated H-X9-DG protein